MPTIHPSDRKNIFETLLKGLIVRFNPERMTLTVELPKENILDDLNNEELPSQNVPHVSAKELQSSETTLNDSHTDLELGPSDFDPIRVKVDLKPYIKLSLHAL